MKCFRWLLMRRFGQFIRYVTGIPNLFFDSFLMMQLAVAQGSRWLIDEQGKSSAQADITAMM